MNARDPLGHSFLLLRWMADQPAAQFGVRELAGALEMQPSTVSRLLTKMSRERLVKRDPTSGEYALGLELVRLGLLASQKLDIRTVARPYLDEVAAQCNETTILGVYDPTRREMLRVDKVASSHPLTYTVRMDAWTEVYRGASGLAIMAYLPDSEREPLLAVADAEAVNDQPWLRRSDLENELNEIKNRGYACTHGRRMREAVAVAAPIFGIENGVVGDVIVTIPEVRWPDYREQDVAAMVMRAAAAISSELGSRAHTVPAAPEL
jgi:DNA-binding IclR family transcriptional regulator